jgi:alpha-galactosidase
MKYDWLQCRQTILDNSSIPYSFHCGGQSCDQEHSVPGTQELRAECTCEVFPESECVEWTVRFHNTGVENSPILSELRSLDLTVLPSEESNPVTIYAIRGCANGAAPFATECIVPERGTTWRIDNSGGGKTGTFLPFVNLDLGKRGLLCGLGWPGRWTLSVEHLADGSIRLTGGIERANLALHPGEEISLPSVLLMFWEGDRLAAHNRFRQHILRYHTPTYNGKPAPDLVSCATWGGMKTHNHLRLIEALHRHQIPFDCYWMDAGWYGAEHETQEYQDLKSEDWFFHVGDWRPNPAVHPHGLKPVSEAAHAAGMRFLLWFEVERAIETSPWFIEHSDWFFNKRNTSKLVGRTCHWYCFNFGNLEARQAMTEWIASRIEELGIDVFRQDANFSPSDSWDSQDTPDRIGISEIRYVEGLLAFWDDLRRRFPHLLLDIVQRRDLASISRALDLSRADHEILPHTDVIASQTALYGLSYWTPVSGTGVPYRPGDDYVALSGLSPSFFMAIFPSISDVPIQVEPPANYPWDWLQHVLETNRRARPFFRGDFHPLLENTQSNQHWTALQFHRIDMNAGMVLVYRRPDSPFTTARFLLKGLADGCCCHLEPTANNCLLLEGNVLEVNFSKAPAAIAVFYCVTQDCNDF